MALKINFDGVIHELENLEINEDENLITLNQTINEIEFELEIKLGLDIKDVISAYKDVSADMEETFLFQHLEFNQSRIVEFRSKEIEGAGRLGYYFNLNAIIDEDTNIFSNNPFTTTAAFRAIVSLLRGNTASIPKVPNVGTKNQLSISDFYQEDIIILTLANENIEKIPNFDFLCQYLFPVNKDGFVYVHDNNNPVKKNDCHLISENFKSMKKTSDAHLFSQKVSPIDPLIQENSYLKELITVLIPSKNSHLFMDFHLLYQAIEIFIDFILKEEIKLLLNRIDDYESYTLKEKVLELNTAKKRTNLLVNKYSKVDNSCKDLLKQKIKPFCDLFMAENDFEKANAENLIIELRNILVHDYKMLYESKLSLENSTTEWRKLINIIEYLLVETVVNFKVNNQ